MKPPRASNVEGQGLMSELGNHEASGAESKKPTGGEKFGSWMARWGFSLLVGFAALGAVYLAWKVAIPKNLPDFALKAEALYRIEVGAGTFLGLYLVIMAFVLALNNRGFSEIGVNGLKAQDMANRAQQDAIQAHEEAFDHLETMLDVLEDSTEESIGDLKAQIKALEAAAAKTPPSP